MEWTIIEWFKELEFYKQILAGVISSIIATAIIATLSFALKKLLIRFFSNYVAILSGKIVRDIEKSNSLSAEETFKDSRDNKEYRIKKIGGQIWMAENLNYGGTNNNIGRYYDDNPDNGKKYGRLYTWEQAIEACPVGWHLPTNEEWQALINFIGGDNIAGAKLKSKSDWKIGGTDDFLFSALPGGLRFSSNGKFYNIGYKGVWWSATKINNTKIYSRGIDYDGIYVFKGKDDKDNLLSVRYIKD